MSKEEFTDDYEVGYGKPPKKSQFQKGVSGNPTGRPKKARELGAALLREANSLITIHENGRNIRQSKHDVAVKVLLNGAMKGKSSDQRLYFSLYPQAFERFALLAQQAKDEIGKCADDLSDDMLAKIIVASQGYKDLKKQSVDESNSKAKRQSLAEVGTA
jgi:hypothetical protein